MGPTPAPEGPVLISGCVSLQFEKLGYSQPWIQVPTSWVYLTGKEKGTHSRRQAYVRHLIGNQGQG